MSDVPPAEEGDRDRRVRAVELLISRLLRIGVITSLGLLVAGSMLAFARPGGHYSTTADLKVLVSHDGGFPRTASWLVQGVAQIDGRAVVVLGLLILIATPILRVAVSILAFAAQRDTAFILVTSLVLLLLILSFFLGHAAG